MHRDEAVLALSAFSSADDLVGPWSAADALLLRRVATRTLRRSADAAALIGREAGRLVDGIEIGSILTPAGGPFGPGWAAHPLISPELHVPYRLREADLTRALAHAMGPGAGDRGRTRALSFLRLLTALAGLDELRATLTDAVRPTVAAEHLVPMVMSRRAARDEAEGKESIPAGRQASPARIDLFFTWPVTSTGEQAVLAVEAKFDAVVSRTQLHHYRRAALQLARGGPCGLVLLTAEPDRAERRYTTWRGVRWFALMRRWETALAAAGDHDDEFTRVRAHIWRHLLRRKGFRQ